MKHVLTIAVSDSSGGAGIQGDLKTIAAHACHGLSVITAITAQNTQSVSSIVAVHHVKEQCVALVNDIPIHAVKIGMLYTLKNVTDVIWFIREYIKPKSIPIVLDPVLFSTTGKQLIEEEAIGVYCSQLIPMVSLMTPNLMEAEFLSDVEHETKTGDQY
jgi:hydroxymethylpyrimidine kinase/phosphomethylpyrimidine kinase